MRGHAQGELLAQVRPSVTTPVDLFVNGDLRVEVTLILLVNRDTSIEEIEIFHDDDGTTYDATTQIFGRDIAGDDDEIVFQAQHPGSGIMIKPGGALGVAVSTADEATISVYGITEDIAEQYSVGV